jgi:hypothetical protein
MADNWRQATPMERAQWQRWVGFYEGSVTKSIVRFHTAATIAGNTQSFLDRHNIALPQGPVFTDDDAKRTQGTLNVYNTIGRILTRVHAWKYGIRIAQGDIDVLAPPDMPPEEWKADQLGAVPIIIYAIAVGGLLVAGLWAGSEMMKASSDKDYTRYKKSILDADKAIMKQPAPVRSDWIRRRKDFEKIEQDTQAKTGILTDIFGAKGAGMLAIAVTGLLVLFALRIAPKKKSD